MTGQVVALAAARRRKYERMYRAYYGDTYLNGGQRNAHGKSRISHRMVLDEWNYVVRDRGASRKGVNV